MLKKILIFTLALIITISATQPNITQATTLNSSAQSQIAQLTDRLATIYNLLADSTNSRIITLRTRLAGILTKFGYHPDQNGYLTSSSTPGTWSTSTASWASTGSTTPSGTLNPNQTPTNTNANNQSPEQANEEGQGSEQPEQASANNQAPQSSDPAVDRSGYDQRRDLDQTPAPQLSAEELAAIKEKCKKTVGGSGATAAVTLFAQASQQATAGPTMCLVRTGKKTSEGNQVLALMMYSGNNLELQVMAISGTPSSWANDANRLISGTRAAIPDGIYRAGHSEGSSLNTTDRKKIPLAEVKVGGNRSDIVIHERLNGSTSGCIGVWNAVEMRKVMAWVDSHLGANKGIPLFVYLKD